MRIDKYLKVSRVIKRRTVAAEASKKGRISINGKVAKPSKEVNVGDVVTVMFGDNRLTFRVTGVAAAVKKEDAGAMYELIEEIYED